MRRAVGDGFARFRSILNHHEPTNEQPRLLSKCSFAVSRPEIVRRADSFFGPIKNHQLSWWFDGEPLKAVSKDSATFGMGLWDH